MHEGSAADIPEALVKHDLGAPDVVLSGIPFSTMPRELGLAILRSVKASLAPGGRFVAYQFRDVVHTLGKQVFDLIKERSDEGWTFIYLGSEPESYDDADRISVSAANARSWGSRTSLSATGPGAACSDAIF